MKHTRCQLMSLTLAGLSTIVSVGARGDEPPQAERNIVKVAAVQISGYDKGDLPRPGYDPTAQLIPYIDRAGRDHAQLVVFPEYVLGHISVPGTETRQIATAAKANAIYVIVGCWEVLADDKFSNTALIFDRNGDILGRYNKTHAAIDHFEGSPPWSRPPTGQTREWMKQNDPEWIMEAGQDLPVFDLDFGRIAVMTCYDGWFPETARVMSLQGAEVIVWINGRGGSVQDFMVQAMMFQNLVAVVATNQAYGSGTMIGDTAGASARIVARCPDRTESYISADLDLKQIRQRRATSRNFAQRRPDLYQALVAPKQTSTHDGAPQVAR